MLSLLVADFRKRQRLKTRRPLFKFHKSLPVRSKRLQSHPARSPNHPQQLSSSHQGPSKACHHRSRYSPPSHASSHNKSNSNNNLPNRRNRQPKAIKIIIVKTLEGVVVAVFGPRFRTRLLHSNRKFHNLIGKLHSLAISLSFRKLR